jgi:hypothetical protein
MASESVNKYKNVVDTARAEKRRIQEERESIADAKRCRIWRSVMFADEIPPGKTPSYS